MVDPAPSVHVGDVLAGKYEVVGHIGEGGMGYVFEGVHRGLNQRVAIKVLQRRKGHDDELIARFEREARAAAKLQSEHTARVMDVDTLADGTPFMVMELLEGHDLEAELCRFGKLPVVEAVDIVLQACSAMAEAHQRGIVHRDLKPPNLFLCERGGVVTVKLLDFGISKMVTEEDKSVTQTSSSLGTPLYMSPEQIRSAKHVDARTDIWSLGVILYELIAGTTPFEADSPTAVIAAITADTPRPLAQTGPDVPVPLSEVVMKALDKHPDRRWQTVDAFAQALLPFGAGGSYVPALRGSGSSVPRAPRDLEEAATLVSTSRAERQTHSSWETGRLAKPSRRAVIVGTSVVVAALVIGAVVLSSRDDPTPDGVSVAAEGIGEEGSRPASTVTPTEVAAEADPPTAPTSTQEPLGTESTATATGDPTATAAPPMPPNRVPRPPAITPPAPTPVAPAPKPTQNPTHL